MNKLKFKQKTLENIRSQIGQAIEDLDEQIKRIQESEMDKDEDQFDMDEEARDEAAHEILDRLTEQRNFLLEQQALLDRMEVKEPLHEEVAPGSVVVTNHGTFFVSVATDDVQVNGEEVRGLSREAPIYEAMKDRKKGETFTFRDVEYEVKEVY